MSSNIEYLSARRSPDSKAPDPRRALRHLDAAHAKLEKLQLWRKQLKCDYEQRGAELDIAVRAVEILEQELTDKTSALDEAQQIIETQKGLIVQLLDELAEQEDTDDATAAPTLTHSDGPSLTARVLAKLSEKD